MNKRIKHFGYIILSLSFIVVICSIFIPDSHSDDIAKLAAIENGKQLYLNNCSTCHNLNGEGTNDAPSLIGVGAAAVDFQVGTGRMPLQQIGAEAKRKRVLFTQSQIHDLATYVGTLSNQGPNIPDTQDYNVSKVDKNMISEGGFLFRANCASCHNFAGSGGALTSGKFAPNIDSKVNLRHIYEAMLTGPEEMPSFNDKELPPDKKLAIISYIKYVSMKRDNSGGLSLGRIGPVAEGFLGWSFVVLIIIGFAIWITAKSSRSK